MVNKISKPTYQTLSDELESLLADMQDDSLDIDQALEQYERGLELISQLEKHLQTAETKIITLRAKASGE